MSGIQQHAIMNNYILHIPHFVKNNGNEDNHFFNGIWILVKIKSNISHYDYPKKFHDWGEIDTCHMKSIEVEPNSMGKFVAL